MDIQRMVARKGWVWIGVLWALMCACETDSLPSPWTQANSLTIGQYLAKNQQEHGKFYRLLDEAGMLQTLYAYNPNGKDWTLFLPTDEAIDQYLAQTPYPSFEALLQDTVFIKKLTRYHILKKRMHTNDFPEGAFVDSTLTGERLVAAFSVENDQQLIRINHHAPIVQPNQEMTNGYIQVISKMLQPSQTPGYDWLQQQQQYTILAQAMELCEVKKKLKWEKYTLMAEPDSVYHRFGILQVEDLVERLATPGLPLTNKNNVFYQYVTYHVLKGEYYLNDFAWGNHDYQTLSEHPLTIDVGQNIRINTGVDSYRVTDPVSGQVTFYGYIRPQEQGCNRLTRTGPVHAISDWMYYEKMP